MAPADAAAVPHRLDLQLAASALGLAAAQEAVLEFLARHATPPLARWRALLVLEEAWMNVALHGHAEPGAHRVDLVLSMLTDALEMRLEDDGRPYDPRDTPAPARPATLAEALPGGFGVHLMRRYARRMDYERIDGRNRLTLLIDRA